MKSCLSDTVKVYKLKQNEAQSACAESTHKGVNYPSKQTQQQRPESPTVTLTWHVCTYKVHKPLESPTVTLTWHACKCKVHRLHQRFMYLVFTLMPGERYRLGDSGLCCCVSVFRALIDHFLEIIGKDNLTVFSYSGRVKSPEWRRQLRRADLRQF